MLCPNHDLDLPSYSQRSVPRRTLFHFPNGTWLVPQAPQMRLVVRLCCLARSLNENIHGTRTNAHAPAILQFLGRPLSGGRRLVQTGPDLET